MNFIWRDYDLETMDEIKAWLDEPAVRFTGLEEGFRAFYEYWAGEEGFVLGENFWCKVVYEADVPFAVIALCLHEGSVNVMEILVAPEKRGQGFGPGVLKELLACQEILGFAIEKSVAVIFFGNTASQKAFEKAGFRYHHTHADGDAVIYRYDRKPDE